KTSASKTSPLSGRSTNSGDVFDAEVLDAVETLTTGAWQIPYSIRVDSVTNFQSTRGEVDDLIVEDLVQGGLTLDQATRDEKRAIALAEPILRDQLVTPNSLATAVNVVLQFPEVAPDEIQQAAAAARARKAEIQAEYPAIAIELTGVAMLNNAFVESGIGDMGSLVPLMYLVVLVAT
ncbi:MAG: RND transporter, partial [Pseudomonadota bacterium]